MQPPPIKDYTLNNILPGDQNSRAQETPTKGYTFYVTEASHSRFSVEINDGPRLRGKLANGDTFAADFDIEKIRVYNDDLTGLPLSINIQVGKFTPLNDLFTVSSDDVTPILRSDTPSIIGDGVMNSPADVAVNTWKKLFDADEFRSEVWLKTDAASGNAFWATSDPGVPAEVLSHDIHDTADASGFVKLKTTSAIWIRLKTANTVRALTFKFAA